MSNLDNTNTPAPANLFKPSEIIGILRNHLATGQVNQRVVCLRGIYFKGSYVNQYYHTATDRLVDESTSDELSLSMPLNLRDDLENGNVITVHGILDRSITNKGLIQIVLKVTEVEKIKELHTEEVVSQLLAGGEGLNEGRLPDDDTLHNDEKAQLAENSRKIKQLLAEGYDLADKTGDMRYKTLYGKMLEALLKIERKPGIGDI
jgi:hypothetical protein